MTTHAGKTNWLSHLLLLLWLLFLAVIVWQYVRKTNLPPIYDAMEYLQKAKNVWADLKGPKIRNPFNVEPTFRPPGTVLMSYPFGFSIDFHGFYFRSTFLPLLCIVGAVYVIRYHKTSSNSQKWSLALLSIFLTSLPAFYHFERIDGDPSGLFWGLVDNFFAGVACLAVAALVRSVTTISMRWLVAGSFLASFCIFIKPVGAVVMLVVGGCWLLTLLLRLRSAKSSPDDLTNLKKMLIYGLPLLVAMEGCAFALCRFSHYLSAANIAYGNYQMHTLQGNTPITLQLLYSLIKVVLGDVFPVLILTIAILTLFFWRRIECQQNGWSRPVLGGLVLSACIYLCTGLWLWLVYAAVSQVRYFTPFALMAFIALVPAAVQLVEILPRWGKACFRLACILPAAVLAFLLVQPSASPRGQEMYGISLASGAFRAQVNEAEGLLLRARETGRYLLVYSLSSSPLTNEVFYTVTNYESLRNPSQPTLVFSSPDSGTSDPEYRISDLLASDYIFFTPVRDLPAEDNMLVQSTIKDFAQEDLLFQSWLATLTENDGVRLISEAPGLRMLAIEDRAKFDNSVMELVRKHSWDANFQEVNPRHWWGMQELRDWSTLHQPSVTNIRFGDVFILHALTYTRSTNQFTVQFWWESTGEKTEDGWSFFVLAMDKKGKTMINVGTPLGSRSPASQDHKIQLDVARFRLRPDQQLATLGVGFFKPPGTLPKADKGQRDWGNTRLIIPVSGD